MNNHELLLTGHAIEQMVSLDEGIQKIHSKVLHPLMTLQLQAKRAGFHLQVVSGFRSYEHQLKIWNQKAQGTRPLLDDHGVALDFEHLSEDEILDAILRWSALPGASRHHWGTEIDVIDGNALKEGQSFELIAAETAPEGIFGNFHLWLDEQIANNQAQGFYRPYEFDQQGVAPEKWHLSYAPLSVELEQQYTWELFLSIIDNPKLLLKKRIKERAPEIFDRFVKNTTAYQG